MRERLPTDRHPVTADEARFTVARMLEQASRKARIAFFRHAIEGFGSYRPNISEEARAVYRAALDRDLSA